MEQQQQQPPQVQPQPPPPQQQQPMFFTFQTQQQQSQPQPQQQQQQQPVFVSIQSPVSSVTQPQTNSPAKNVGFNETAGKITGVIQVMCGIASIVLGVCAILFGGWPIGWPIWSGTLYLACGIVGACTKRGKTCLIVGYMVMCVISAFFAGGQVIFEIFASIVTRDVDCSDYGSFYDCDFYYGGDMYPSTGMNIAAAVAAVAEVVTAIVGSAYCCHGVCRSNRGTPAVVQYTDVQQSGQPVSVPYPQPGAAPVMLQYTQPGAPVMVQNPHPGAPAQFYPQGAIVYYPPQGVPAQVASQGAPPDYDTSAPEDKADVELQQ